MMNRMTTSVFLTILALVTIIAPALAQASGDDLDTTTSFAGANGYVIGAVVLALAAIAVALILRKRPVEPQ
jgi:hypothetical protein